MSAIGQPERATQNRVIALFRDELGYRYLGDWTDRDGNSNIEEGLLTAWLTKRGYTPAQISAALHKLRTEADNHNRSLYGNNQAVYSLLRYGVPVKIEAGKVTETVHLINWEEPEKNDFAIAEEVTLHGQPRAAARPRALRQRHRRRRAGAEEQPRHASATASARTSPTSSRSSTTGSSAPCSSSSPATTPRACNTAPSARRRSIS